MMKKVLSLGFAGLLLLGASSQALAAFESGNMILSITDEAKSTEMGIDLGVLNLSLVNQTYDFNIDLTSYSSSSIIGTFAKLGQYNAIFGVNMASDVTVDSKSGSGRNYLSGTTNQMQIVSNYYNSIDQNDGNVNGIAVIDTDNTNYSYVQYLSAYKYGRINKSGEESQVTLAGNGDRHIDVYLYNAFVVAEGNPNAIGLTNNGNYVAHLTIDLDYNETTKKLMLDSVTLNPSAVPVPGAALLFGSALLGLAGVRRRQFQG